jgi:hypothetical protein
LEPHWADLHGSDPTSTLSRQLARPLDRFIEISALDNVIAGKLLFRLGKGPDFSNQRLS